MAKLVDAGIDYIRVTSQDARDHNNMEKMYNEIADGDRKLGYKEHAGGAFGFYGHATRHALYAAKDTWRMLQISGGRAKKANWLISESSQATRIDIQETVQLEGVDVSTYLGELACNLNVRRRREGHQADITEIRKNGAVQTIYIGSRKSDWFFRIYDKYAESHDEAYKNCVRFELEIKGRASKGIWHYMASANKGVIYLLRILEGKYREYGIEIPEGTGMQGAMLKTPSEEKCVEKTLRWMERAVAPSFSRVASELGWLQPLLAIISDTLYDSEVQTVAREVAIVWGS